MNERNTNSPVVNLRGSTGCSVEEIESILNKLNDYVPGLTIQISAGTPEENVCSHERLVEIVDEVLGPSLDIQVVSSGKGFDSSDSKGAVVREGQCQFKKILVGESILARVKKFVERLCKLGK